VCNRFRDRFAEVLGLDRGRELGRFPDLVGTRFRLGPRGSIGIVIGPELGQLADREAELDRKSVV